MPTVVDILDPKCFDYSEQLKQKDTKVEQTNSESAQVSPESKGAKWTEEFNKKLEEALKNVGGKNLCYTAINTFGLFQDGISSGKADETQKWEDIKKASKASIGCSGKEFEGNLKAIKNGMGKISKNGKSYCPWLEGEAEKEEIEKTLSKLSITQDTLDLGLWDIALCGYILGENIKNDYGSISGIKKGENGIYQIKGFGNEEQKKALSQGNFFEKMAIEIPVKESWSKGLSYPSICISATAKR